MVQGLAALAMHDADRQAVDDGYTMARAAAGEPVTASDLGAHLHLTRASATALVDRLAAAGHVRRHRDEGDRRRVLDAAKWCKQTKTNDNRTLLDSFSSHT